METEQFHQRLWASCYVPQITTFTQNWKLPSKAIYGDWLKKKKRPVNKKNALEKEWMVPLHFIVPLFLIFKVVA